MTPTPIQAAAPRPAAPKPAPAKMNVWLIVSIILAIALIALVITNYTGANKGEKIQPISTEDASAKLLDFVNKIYGTQLGTLTVKEVTEENGLYKATFTLTDPTTGQPVEQPAFITKDGEKFIPQMIDISEALDQFQALQQQAAQQQAAQPAATAAVEPTPTPTPEPTPAE